MTDTTIFHSRDLTFKRPFGAVTIGTQVSFTIHLPLAYSFCEATLLVYADDFEQHITMAYQKTQNDQVCYRGTFTPEAEGVYFYLFRIQHQGETCFIKRAQNGEGLLAQEGPDFQLTVYNPKFTTPSWIKGGVMYQIFPDRFCRSNEHHPGVPKDRILRSDWGGMPYFMPNENGEVLNDDYFGGDLLGIIQKLPYLQSLGVTMLYLNPIFLAHSSHRYNTADYLRIDPLLGTQEDFTTLCKRAKEFGMRIVLDGVFSHTGSDSIYFNKEGRYSDGGAYHSPQSPYYSWYKFIKYPSVYKTWWGFPTLPEIEKDDPSYREFICGENGVVRTWLRAGASGFRLDVADELPEDFIVALRDAVKAEGEENLLLGEVWEDASNKTGYGKHRRYFLGDELDSVMNYPFKDAILWFLRSQDKQGFVNAISSIVENYPPAALNVCMNSLSTHDTERAINMLVGQSAEGHDRVWQAHHQLTMEQYALGKQRLKAAMVLQYFLPGVPCVYYGDEAGLQGYKDPFNRMCYPWGHEDEDLVAHCRLLGALRYQVPALKEGSLTFLNAPEGILGFSRKDADGQTLLLLNYTDEQQSFAPALSHYKCHYGEVRGETIYLNPYDFALLSK